MKLIHALLNGELTVTLSDSKYNDTHSLCLR